MGKKKITDLSEDATPQLSDYTVTHDGTNAKKTTWQSIKDLIGVGFTPENGANKSTNVVADQASNTKYPSVKSVFDWVAGLGYITASALSGYATQAWVTSQGFITNVVTALGFTPENVSNKKTDLTDNSDTFYPTQKAVKTAVDGKQNTLVSGTNIKTINGSSVLGSGDLVVAGSLPAGTVLQVKTTRIGPNKVTVNSATPVAVMTVSITPSSANNLIVIQAVITGTIYTYVTSYGFYKDGSPTVSTAGYTNGNEPNIQATTYNNTSAGEVMTIYIYCL